MRRVSFIISLSPALFAGLLFAFLQSPFAASDALGEDYWTDGGAFDSTVTAEHYGNAANYIKGFSSTEAGLLSTMSDADLTAVSSLTRRVHGGKTQVLLSTLYPAEHPIGQHAVHMPGEPWGLNSAFVPRAEKYVNDPWELWFTPHGQLHQYMNARKDQWTQYAPEDYYKAAYDHRQAAPATHPLTLGELAHRHWGQFYQDNVHWSQYEEAGNPYNRAAASLGMLNGYFSNPDPASSDNYGFGNFYRVADVWVNEDEIFHTSVSSHYDSNVSERPAGPGAQPENAPVNIDLSWSQAQEDNLAFVDFSPAVDVFYTETYEAWYKNWWNNNTATGVFPWTGMGYTYDWFYGYDAAQYATMRTLAPTDTWSVRSFTELVLPPGADYWVASEAELQDYLASPLYAVPEPAALLLALLGLALLPRWRRGGHRRG